jgi:hypothetical protein
LRWRLLSQVLHQHRHLIGWMLDLPPVSHRGTRIWHIGNSRRTEWSWQCPKVMH